MNKKIFYGVFVLLVLGLFVISGCQSEVGRRISTNQPQVVLGDGCVIAKTPEFNELIEKNILEVTSTGLVFSDDTTTSVTDSVMRIENPRISIGIIYVTCSCSDEAGTFCGTSVGGSGTSGGSRMTCDGSMCPDTYTCSVTISVGE